MHTVKNQALENESQSSAPCPSLQTNSPSENVCSRADELCTMQPETVSSSAGNFNKYVYECYLIYF